MTHVSKLNGKMDRMIAIGTNTLKQEFCQKMSKVDRDDWICRYCYSHATLGNGYRPNVKAALDRNWFITERPLEDHEIPRFYPGDVVRFSHHGDVESLQHAENYLAIVRANPKVIFGWWTKRPGMVQAVIRKHGKPENLFLVWSNPFVNKLRTVPPMYFDKVFNNVTRDKFVDQQDCTGQRCRDCMTCYTRNDKTYVVEAIRKR